MRRALIIGIDDYSISRLHGCVQDARRLEKVLSRHHDGAPNFECRVIDCPPNNANKADLRPAIEELFGDPAEIAWLHFSGHGLVNELDGFLATADAKSYDEGVPMSHVLTFANQSRVAERIITLDCCHSGALGAAPPLNSSQAHLSEGVSIVTATRTDQASLEVGGGGVFTSLLVEALEGGAANILGQITAAGVYAYIDNALGAWDQRPLFKTNVARFVRLRQAGPRVPLDLLRRITKHFPVPAEDRPLDPSYEPAVEPRNPKNEETFADLQRLRAAGLVEPLGEEHMYYAAVNSGACRLTRLGLYYWRVVNDGRI